ncbi:MAG: hypothetical protein AAFP19_10390 [Bacteroidota bacterium]
MLSEREYLRSCLLEIEQQLLLDREQEGLKRRHFEYIAKMVEEKSGVNLSLSTIKRIWKEDFVHMPHPTTLDALVALLGHRDWQTYRQQVEASQLPPPVPPQKRYAPNWLWLLLIPLLILATFLLLPSASNHPAKPQIKGPIQFSASTTRTQGVPNTVSFDYDVSAVKADSFCIQLSWNERNRMAIAPGQGVLSGTYYTPSYHKARLIANEEVIARADVFIQSDGWMPYLRYNRLDRIPIYFNEPSYTHDGVFGLKKEVLEKANIDIDQIYDVRYANIQRFPGIRDGSFSLTTRLRCDSIGPLVCPLIDLMLVFEKNIFDLELINKGCEGNVGLYIGGASFDGEDTDLRGLGCAVYEWQDLNFRVENRKAGLWLNKQLVIQSEYSEDFGDLVGVIYSFSGTGFVDFLHLYDEEGQLRYSETFEEGLQTLSTK